MTDQAKLNFWRTTTWTLLILSGIVIVAYWGTAASALLLLWWVPVIYGFANLIPHRQDIVRELRNDPLWFSVSRPESYEHGYGHGRTFRWNADLVRAHAAREDSNSGPYYIDVGSGAGWFSGDAFGQSLDFSLGSRRNLLVIPNSEATRLFDLCRNYDAATSNCITIFLLGWIIAVPTTVLMTYQQTVAALGVGTAILVWWGLAPKWSMRDRTEDRAFVCRSHIHVYTYFPGNDEIAACYFCACGRREIARDENDEDSSALGQQSLPLF